MQYIDMDTWARKEHFEFFHRMDYPQYNICMNIDITHFLKSVREKGISFYYAFVYAVTHTANEVAEFRYRIREGGVIIHNRVHCSFTDMGEGDLFKMVTVDYIDDIVEFVNNAKEVSSNQTDYLSLEASKDRDDLLYITCVPWITFTHVSHTITLNKDDSVPRIAWGKYYKDGDRVLMPFSVQVNHAVVDGVHIGKYVEKLQEFIDNL